MSNIHTRHAKRKRAAAPGITANRPGWSRLHNNGGYVDVGLDALVGENASTIDVDLVADGHIVTQHSNVFEACPFTDSAVPADNSALDPGVVFDFGAGQNGAPLETNTVTNHAVLANNHVGADTAVLSNFGSLVDHDVAAIYIAL